MKYIKELNESFQLFKQIPVEGYAKRVKDDCYNIAMQSLQISEKAFDALDRLELVMEQILADRQQEFDVITSNCSTRKFRTQYCAEIVYNTIYQGRLNALAERDWVNGGFKS